MSLIDEVEKLLELRKNLRSLDVDGCSLLYPDGDEAARCRGDLGNDESTSGTDLAESLCRLHNLAPAMLEVLGCHEEYDSAVLKAMKSVLIGAGVQGGSPMMNVLDRHIRAAALMEQEREG